MSEDGALSQPTCEECSQRKPYGKEKGITCEDCGAWMCERCVPTYATAFQCDACERQEELRAREKAAGEDPASRAALSLGAIIRHQACVGGHLFRLAAELTARARQHDLSKLREDELSSYLALGRALHGVEFGTAEYAEAIEQFRPAVDLHKERNSHHPEFHRTPADMGLLDLVEMVCDWAGASEGYTGAPDLAGSLRAKIGDGTAKEFTEAQRWVILQVVDILQPDAVEPSTRRQWEFLTR